MKTLTLFVTNKCNLKCKTCFNWQNLNQGTDLTLSQFKSISKKLPHFTSLTVSGGEPFLRKDLPEIIDCFNVSNVGIPTNGYFPKKIYNMTRQLLEDNPQIEFQIICSLDGTKKTHDFIKGDSFDNVIKTINLLKRLTYNNLKVTVNTVINNTNVSELRELVDFVMNLNIDNHHFDLIRGLHQQILKLPSSSDLDRIDRIRYETIKHYSKTLTSRYLTPRLYKRIHYNQRQALNHKNWDVTCVAGKSLLTVAANGELSFCELLLPIGNLLNLDLKTLLDLPIAKQQKKDIQNHKCDCTYFCNLAESCDKWRLK